MSTRQPQGARISGNEISGAGLDRSGTRRARSGASLAARLGTLITSLLLASSASAEAPGTTSTSAKTGEPGTVLDALLDGGRIRIPLGELAGRVSLSPNQSFRVAELGRDAHSSHHAVAIRTAEVPHRHDHHDLLVVMVRGHGSMRIGDEKRPVGVGSVLYVPRGAVHAFHNDAKQAAIAYAVYTPAFDGKDRVEVEEPLDRDAQDGSAHRDEIAHAESPLH